MGYKITLFLSIRGKIQLKNSCPVYVESRILQGRYSFCPCCLSELLPIGYRKTWRGGGRRLDTGGTRGK